jgi:hypothetical protein
MPHFSLAAAAGGLFVSGGVGIVGMNLDRQSVCREYEFDKKREVINVGEPLATPRCGHFRPGSAERFSCEWTGSDAAIHAREPGFAQRLRQIRFLGEERC